MGRRRHTLLERLLAGTFRPKQHRDLLATERLPRTPPSGVDRNLWRELRLVQTDYADAGSHAERLEIARAFADLADRVAASRKAEAVGIHALILGAVVAPADAESAAEGYDVDAELLAWERTYGAAWRVRHDLAGPDEVDEFPADAEIPDPPGLDAVEERARFIFGRA